MAIPKGPGAAILGIGDPRTPAPDSNFCQAATCTIKEENQKELGLVGKSKKSHVGIVLKHTGHITSVRKCRELTWTQTQEVLLWEMLSEIVTCRYQLMRALSIP